jgi:hypothetical protein
MHPKTPRWYVASASKEVQIKVSRLRSGALGCPSGPAEPMGNFDHGDGLRAWSTRGLETPEFRNSCQTGRHCGRGGGQSGRPRRFCYHSPSLGHPGDGLRQSRHADQRVESGRFDRPTRLGRPRRRRHQFERRRTSTHIRRNECRCAIRDRGNRAVVVGISRRERTSSTGQWLSRSTSNARINASWMTYMRMDCYVC